MIKHFIRFEGKPNGANRDEARVTLNAKKVFLLNPRAVEALGHPSAVELHFDEARKVIGLKPVDPQRSWAFKLKPLKCSPRHRFIFASAFCTHFQIRVENTVQFQNIGIDEDMLTLDMTKTVNVGRGSR